jgi:hypothetical protein
LDDVPAAVEVVGATVLVTMMSVPTEPSGERIRFWALDNPSDTPLMAMTRPTPAARPSAVTIVRPDLRCNSFHTYPRLNKGVDSRVG